MIIVKPVGGFGNQMFPYATGRRLAHVLGAQLKLDLSGFVEAEKRTDLDFRRFSLDTFKIQAEIATAEEVRSLTRVEQGPIGSAWHRMLHNKPKRPKSYVREKGFRFDPKILELKGDLYLDGNWASWKYFADHEEVIRQDFTFKDAAQGKNRALLDEIESTNSVSLHVRRGDIVTNPKVNEIYGTCDLGYYESAIDQIAHDVSNPHFFLFSDEPEWVKNNLKLDYPHTYLDHNGPLAGHEDLRLMSSCKHHITANSGFSWWGAWLNRNPGKIVIAPKRWFQSAKYDTSDLVPDAWRRV